MYILKYKNKIEAFRYKCNALIRKKELEKEGSEIKIKQVKKLK